jgi:2-polyprenyl-3-methyl-5-hydroxy-6-metoxy-1,4-benzoquinol methylase
MSVQARYERYWSAESPSPLTDPLSAERQQFVWDLQRAASAPLRLLDAGAGDGALLAAAAARGIDAVGLELSGAAITRARAAHPDVDLRRHSVEELPWPVEPASFDVVASFEVIEHLLEPSVLVEGARSALRTGGAFVLSTPYHGLVKNLALAAVAFERHFAVEGDHVRFFTDAALARLLERHGFLVERIAHLGRVPTLWANTVVVARKA